MNTLRKVTKYAPHVGTAVATSFYAFAANAGDYTGQITTASGEANANQTAVIAAVVGLAVIGFGVGMFMKWLNK